MKTQLITITVVLLFLVNLTGRMTAQENTSPDYEVVKKTIEQSIGWAIEKDFDAMFLLW